jgi:hypothetical protein
LPTAGRWARPCSTTCGSGGAAGRCRWPGCPAWPRWELTVAEGQGGLNPLTSFPAAGPPLALGPRGLAALYAGTPVGTLRRAGLASGGSPEGDAALDAAFGATAYMLDSF